jgi:hypothetical protein
MTARTNTDRPPRTAYTAREVAASTGLPYRKVLSLCASGAIRCRREGKYFVIPIEALREFLDAAGTDAAA